LAPNYVATITPRYIRRRGTLYQSEFRYLNNFGQGALSVNSLSNDKQIIATQQSDATSAETAQQLEPDRNYVSWNHSGRYGQHWSSHAYAEYASDEEYFHDFGNDFNTSNLAYLNRSATLLYRDQFWQLGTSLQGFQTIDNDIAEKDRPYMQLPVMTLNASYPLSRYFDLQFTGESTYYIREIDDPFVDNIEGNRMRLVPALQATFSSAWGHIIPRVKLQQLNYSLESDADSEDVTVPLFSLDTGLFFERDFKWKNTQYRQTLDPRLFYLYAPTKPQDHLPNFDSSELTFNYSQLFRDSRFSGGDRLADYNQVSLGLSSTVSSRNNGEEVLSIALGQAFFLKDPEVRLLESNDTPERSPISGYLSLRPAENWLLNASFSWNGDHNIHEENSFGATYIGDSGQLMNIELRSRENLVGASYNQRSRLRQSKLSFAWPLLPRWKVLGYWHYNIKDQANLEGDLSIETLVGVQYENCCVQIKILNHRYLQEQFDQLTPKRQLRLQIRLKGLANLDDQVSDILQRTIPYYQ
ncbi:MAG: LPS-assembly protein LptD, partial [Pseudomonadales bacterium]|nr:LPS-assembly protein LptD [Pseudomonadales bacterium]